MPKKKKPPPPDLITCDVVASFQCPRCKNIMARERVRIEGLDEPIVAYHCHNPDCDQNGVHYYPPKVRMSRVGAIEAW